MILLFESCLQSLQEYGVADKTKLRRHEEFMKFVVRTLCFSTLDFVSDLQEGRELLVASDESPLCRCSIAQDTIFERSGIPVKGPKIWFELAFSCRLVKDQLKQAELYDHLQNAPHKSVFLTSDPKAIIFQESQRLTGDNKDPDHFTQKLRDSFRSVPPTSCK